MWADPQLPVLNILLVNDDELYAHALAHALERRFRAHVLLAENAESALGLLSNPGLDLVISEWDIASLELRDRLSVMRGLPLVVLTGENSSDAAQERLLGQGFHFLGAVSKEQTIDDALYSIEMIVSNSVPNA